MAQDLIKISLESFVLQLPSISFGTLKRLYAELYQYMRNNGKSMEPREVFLIQRKITKIQRELNGRHKLRNDFHEWDRKLQRDLRRG